MKNTQNSYLCKIPNNRSLRLFFTIKGLLSLLALTAFTSCTVTAPLRAKIGAAGKGIATGLAHPRPRVNPVIKESPRFLAPISPVEGEKLEVAGRVYIPHHTGGTSSAPILASTVFIQPNELSYAEPVIETASPLQLKFAVLMDTEVEHVPEESLLRQVDEWLGVRYRSGGNTKSGIDCSGFTCAVYANYCAVQLPRTSREQFQFCEPVELHELRPGDFLFFKTRGRSVSHVGLYLGNNKFIHASVSSGVIVSDRFEPYYLKRFVGAGRIPANWGSSFQ